MHKPFTKYVICRVAVAFVALANVAWAQDRAQTYCTTRARRPLLNRWPTIRRPTTGCCHRQAVLIQIWRNGLRTWKNSWAKYAKAADDAKSAPPTKPLIAPSGRIQFDMANFSQNAASDAQFGNAQNTVGFRRARLALLGEYEQVDYIIEMDFANRGIASAINQKDQSTAFKDVYIQLRDLPVHRQCPRRPLQGMLWARTTHQRQLHHVHGAVPLR